MLHLIGILIVLAILWGAFLFGGAMAYGGKEADMRGTESAGCLIMFLALAAAAYVIF